MYHNIDCFPCKNEVPILNIAVSAILNVIVTNICTSDFGHIGMRTFLRTYLDVLTYRHADIQVY